MTSKTSEVTAPLPSGLAAVEQEIARACRDFGRDRATVTLIAVSKTFGAEAIVPVIADGQRVFGDRRTCVCLRRDGEAWADRISALSRRGLSGRERQARRTAFGTMPLT